MNLINLVTEHLCKSSWQGLGTRRSQAGVLLARSIPVFQSALLDLTDNLSTFSRVPFAHRLAQSGSHQIVILGISTLCSRAPGAITIHNSALSKVSGERGLGRLSPGLLLVTVEARVTVMAAVFVMSLGSRGLKPRPHVFVRLGEKPYRDTDIKARSAVHIKVTNGVV